ncbi:hypothetical protein SAMN05421595_1260 [Austwickia chelonae]|uniref:Uncharacterized protein n=1 Tax=Austwickia chelonae NBRC 105200 TaxID=1184607 RepID=K6VPX2_9MICO|nr:hypothetical protein [Austwickia chelonae]GAB77425.1 hypothetical protein AUCHE_05_03360 [Austwickia chelonae NBRC 105200]SEW10177.1 hypothetical protein SAMN05421595_1260 [Austwickia chelonae]
MSATPAEAWTTARHPLARLLRSIAAGQKPEPNGQWARVSPWIPTIQAMVVFPEHTIMAVSYDISDETLVDLGVDGHGQAFTARTVTALAGPTGWVGVPQILFCSLGTGAGQGGSLVARSDLSKHPAVELARRTLQDVQVLGAGDPADPDVVILGRGVAGVREIAVHRPHPYAPGGAQLVQAALGCVPENEVVLRCISTYDAPRISAAVEGGMTPIGGVQLFSTRPEHKL